MDLATLSISVYYFILLLKIYIVGLIFATFVVKFSRNKILSNILWKTAKSQNWIEAIIFIGILSFSKNLNPCASFKD